MNLIGAGIVVYGELEIFQKRHTLFICLGSITGSVCPSGTPLSHVFCGLGGTGCPSGYYCEVAPNDAYAVCCPRQGIVG